MADIREDLEKIEKLVEKLEGYEEDYYDYDYDYSGLSTPSGTTYGLQVKNISTTTDYVIRLFGYGGERYLSSEKPADIQIQALEGFGSYDYFLKSCYINPVEIESIKFHSTQEQIDALSLAFVKTSPFGKEDKNVLPISTYRTEKDYQLGILTVPVRFIISIDHSIEFKILKNTTLTIILFVGVRKVIAKPLERMKKPPALITKTGKITLPTRKKFEYDVESEI
jgi:hypothetical protein